MPATAICATHPQDLWFADNPEQRALAAHLCLTHCPLLAACQATTVDRAWGIWAGIPYTATGDPDGRGLAPSSAGCHICNRPPVARRTHADTNLYDDCGTYRAYRRHLRRKQPTCAPCRKAARDHKPKPGGGQQSTGYRPRWQASARAAKSRADLVAKIRPLVAEGLRDRDIAARLHTTARRIRHLRTTHHIPSQVVIGGRHYGTPIRKETAA